MPKPIPAPPEAVLDATAEPITVAVSINRKINLGNYESVDVFFSLSGVPVGADDAELLAAMETAEQVFQHVRQKVVEKVQAVKGARS